MNQRMRAASSTPAMPSTRSRGKPETRRATSHMASSGLVTMIRMVSGERETSCSHHLGDDLGVLGQQVVAAHAGLPGEAGGDHADVRAGGGVVVAAAGDAGVEAQHRRRLHHVQGLAGGELGGHVHHHHVGQVGLRDQLGTGGAHVAGAHHGDFVTHRRVSLGNRLLLDVLDDRFRELRRLEQRRAFHLALEVVGHALLLDGAGEGATRWRRRPRASRASAASSRRRGSASRG